MNRPCNAMRFGVDKRQVEEEGQHQKQGQEEEQGEHLKLRELLALGFRQSYGYWTC